MVTITKGDKTLSIPNGALPMYLGAGWTKLSVGPSKPEKSQPKATPEKPVKVEESKPVVEEELEEDVEYVDPEELLEKPLEDLDFEELKILAEYLDIDVKGMKSSKQIKAAIREARK